ncbi:preprotein translocase subunit SecA [Marispirochaeta aestuarii]|uniref:preprotein translocase subunit SecA n=1 Tax=Marispirochaeta aestuarii TaxID=1963862 RepID=UPI0029C7D195|nr:preprotein translocase subunit SecA [Marispirochaeta aestuarii]
MIQKILNAFFGSQHERDLKQLLPVLHKINALESWAMGLENSQFAGQTEKFKNRLKQGESLEDILPEAFALAREAARRVLGERHYDVQLLGGIVLHHGKIMEMKTGEGKTLSSVTAAYLNSLTGKGVHIITVNDYLAERDAAWMRPVYELLGISVGSILSDMDTEARKEAYGKDITYGTNNEFGFDYLRDNMAWDIASKVQRNHHFCIIDEIDSILIDEARTPLIISGQAEDDTRMFTEVNRLVGRLQECDKDPETGDYPEEPEGDYKIDEKSKRVTFTDQGMNNIEKLLLQGKLISGSLFTEDNFEYIHYFTQAMKAHRLFKLDRDYVVQEGQVQIVDEFTGRILHGRRYSDGLHQAIEAKEGIRIARRNKTLATITFQNFFRMYDKISGMTGTADTEAKEFGKIYSLDVVVIPTNRPVVRKDENDAIYFNEDFKFNAICEEIQRVNKIGQPILVGTVSIEKSERLSSMLTKRGIRHEVLNAKNHHREAMIVAEAGAKGSVTIATNMAGRGTDIKLGGNPEFRTRKEVGTEASAEEYEKAYKRIYAKTRLDYEEVKSLGGLYILGTERHESRRIDNQLRGRSGRQGDPGVSRFFLSLDDDLMRLFANDNMKNIMGKLGMSSGEALFHPWLNKTIERAQTRVEDRNFEIRKHLLEYDDVLNEQRTFIYNQRDEILKDDSLYKRILGAAEEIIDDLLANYATDRSETGITELLEGLQERFFYSPDLERDRLLEMPVQDLRDFFLSSFEADIREKEDKAGKVNFNSFIRFEYLRLIDSKWQDHLENLESLREAVYLRAYGQKNPLLEYKLEGFQIFDTLIQEIREGLAKKVISVRIERADSPRRVPSASAVTESHRQLGQFAAGSRPAQPKGDMGTGTVTVERSVPKVGRNDPCPCGSGKKYKHCHGS